MSKRIPSILVSKELFNNLKEILIISDDDQTTKLPNNQTTKQPNNQTTKQPNNQTTKQHQCKTLLLFFLLCFLFHESSIAQVDYWLEFNEGYDIGSITQTTRANQTIEIDIANNSLESFLNNQMVYKIRKAFPHSNKSRLLHTYIISLNPFSNSISSFQNRPEVRNLIPVDEDSALRKYIYHLIQKDAITGEVIGGETFEIRKKGLHIFQAQAIGPATAIKNAPISLSATLINEEATYNWYDSEGNLIHQGENFDITPTKTETYKLEVIATKDGFKDYDQVSVSVPPHEIISISPNPSSTTITVDYFAQGASEGYISLVSTSTAATHNYVLDLGQETITIDISNLSNGYYEMALVTDNQVQDSETILKN